MATASNALGPARRSAKFGNTKSQVVIIDPQKLRQAALVRLLEDWADANGLIILAVSSPEDVGAVSSCCVVVLNLGGASVLENGTQVWMKVIRSVLGGVPLVILSDREDRTEIAAAFEQGARGFIGTNVEPALALEALNFLRRGGSFFPPSMMMPSEPQAPPLADLTPPGTSPEPEAAHQATLRLSARVAGPGIRQPLEPIDQRSLTRSSLSLTPRQFDVLERLREGKANKLIARELHMTEATVKVHVRQIMRKFGATNRTQAVLCSVGVGLAREESSN